jgi:hypothetical protein
MRGGGQNGGSHDNIINPLRVENTFIALSAMETVYDPKFYVRILRKCVGFDYLQSKAFRS